MCMNCVTQADALALQSVGVVAMASAAWHRLQALISPTAWAARRRYARQENAAFIRSLGLDPVAVLGREADGVPETAERI